MWNCVGSDVVFISCYLMGKLHTRESNDDGRSCPITYINPRTMCVCVCDTRHKILWPPTNVKIIGCLVRDIDHVFNKRTNWKKVRM